MHFRIQRIHINCGEYTFEKVHVQLIPLITSLSGICIVLNCIQWNT